VAGGVGAVAGRARAVALAGAVAGFCLLRYPPARGHTPLSKFYSCLTVKTITHGGRRAGGGGRPQERRDMLEYFPAGLAPGSIYALIA
jgi:hypothetical protein